MILRLTLLIIDAFLFYGTFWLSYMIRYKGKIPSVNFTPFQESGVFLVVITLTALVYAGVFRRRFRSYWQLLQKITFGLLLGTVTQFIFMYLVRSKWGTFPSGVFLVNFGLSVLVMFLTNALILRLNGKIKKRVVILGDSEFYDPFQKKESLVQKKYVTDIGGLINCRDIDEVMICQRLHNNPNMNLLIYLLLKLNVIVTFSPAIYAELVAGKVCGEPMVNLFSTFIGRQNEGQEFLIRLLDISISLIMLIFMSPLLAVIAVLVKLSNPGPVIYKQKRVGKDGKIFTLYKFRTMINDAEKSVGPTLATNDDPRVTKIGKFMRETRVDEMPQLLNVLLGQMSLVGPRPERPHFVKLHKALREIRLAVKPGLTGLAQVRNSYDLHPKHKIKYDYLYIQRRSLALNLYILYKTIFVVLGRKGQ